MEIILLLGVSNPTHQIPFGLNPILTYKKYIQILNNQSSIRNWHISFFDNILNSQIDFFNAV
jgi:hypothetical protein